jgi:putative IMPACT (imprinted ancient) family translation regulator
MPFSLDADERPGAEALIKKSRFIECAESTRLVNVVAVVSRYFGGVELGAGGLARAYSGAVTSAIEAATLHPRIAWQVLRLAADHAEAGRVQAELRARGFEVADVAYGERAVLTILCTDDARLRTAVDEMTSGSGELIHVRRMWR